MKIFIVQGALIGVIGTVLGVAGGVLLALNIDTVVPVIERLVGVDLFPADVYYINELPSKLVWSDVGIIGGDLAADQPGRHAVSELARLAHQPGGGAAL